MSHFLRRTARALHALFSPNEVVVYPPVNALQRAALNLHATARFLRTREGVGLLLLAVLWVLAGFHLVWRFDLTGTRCYAPFWTALFWLWPWLADGRQRQLQRQSAETMV